MGVREGEEGEEGEEVIGDKEGGLGVKEEGEGGGGRSVEDELDQELDGVIENSGDCQ